jgi:ATP-dependent DNA helicase RecQ
MCLSNRAEVRAETRKSKRRAKLAESDISYNTELFEGLRSLRKMLADKSRIPPYAVFPDKSLIEMSAYYPTTEESMLQIYGVGAGRFAKYGSIFLNTIRQFAGSKEEEAAKSKPDISIRSQYGKKKYHKVGEAYNAGASIEKLIADNNVQIGTIFGHLYNYWLDDYPLRNSDFSSFVNIGNTEKKRVFAAFKDEGTELLRPVFEALDEKYDYTKLRILRVCYIVEQSVKKKIKKQELKYEKENEPWSEYDDTLLAKIYETEKDLKKLGALFLRKPESVGIRLLKLGIPEGL